MPSEKNLNAVFTDIANAIREKKGITDQIKPINMAEEIVNLSGGGGGSLKKLLDATKSCYMLFYKYTGTNVDGLISYSDTENVTDMYGMFNSCKNLTSIPKLDTSNVTSMASICTNCVKLTTIPQFDTSNVTLMSGMFQNCSKLKDIPQLNTSNVTSMTQMFYGCTSLTHVPQLDVSNVTNMSTMFYNCTSLYSIEMIGMKVSFTISDSTAFRSSDLVLILNNLSSVTSTQTLKMGSRNLAKLTDEEKAIATNKGWTLA